MRQPNKPLPIPMTSDESKPILYRVLADRCRSLEAAQVRLKEQLEELVHDKNESVNSPESVNESPSHRGFELPGFYLSGTPYKRILELIGHAMYVCSTSNGEIVFWNRAAEKLYGWKDYEVLGNSITEVLIAKDYHTPLRFIMEKIHSGRAWSGQFPLKKKNGETFMALVTKSPLYEDGQIVGIVTCSIDAAIINGSSENARSSGVHSDGQRRVQGSNLNKIEWHPRNAPVPQIASSVSNLASKVLSGRSGHDTSNACERDGSRNDSAAISEDTKPQKKNGLAARIFSKLHIKGIGNYGNGDLGAAMKQNGENDTSVSTEVQYQRNSHRHESNAEGGEEYQTRKFSLSSRSSHNSEANAKQYPHTFEEDDFILGNSRDKLLREENHFPKSDIQIDRDVYENEGMHSKVLGLDDKMLEKPDVKQLARSGTSGTQGSSPRKGDNEDHAVVDCEIRWEDLHIGEEIGQGSFAVVYRGIWNGSDVAIKVYFGNEYNEVTLQDYRKEINIMKRLRHPNVLLFMGAVYSNEKLAIVTEFLPRGSLFKTLHKNNQMMDTKRRLRMALDVARGVNYLHRRNPPIVHRDLKSSNLLVDKNWTVKVGDFGLSRLKEATLLHTKSGRGTPQWMAPEVLRNEPSNEKSDVFSYGVILWELMTESVPWSNLNSLQVVGVVGFMDRRLDIPENLDPQIASIIQDCWRSDPGQRPSFEEIIPRVTNLVNRTPAMSARKNVDLRVAV